MALWTTSIVKQEDLVILGYFNAYVVTTKPDPTVSVISEWDNAGTTVSSY